MAPVRPKRSPGTTPPMRPVHRKRTPDVKSSPETRPKIMLKFSVPKPQPQPIEAPGARRTSARVAAARKISGPPVLDTETSSRETRTRREPDPINATTKAATDSISDTTLVELEVEVEGKSRSRDGARRAPEFPDWGAQEVDAAALLVQLSCVDGKSKFADDRDGGRLAGAEALIALSRGPATMWGSPMVCCRD